MAAAATYYIIENNSNGMMIPLLPLINDNTAAAEEALTGLARHSGDLPSTWPAAGHGPRGAARDQAGPYSRAHESGLKHGQDRSPS